MCSQRLLCEGSMNVALLLLIGLLAQLRPVSPDTRVQADQRQADQRQADQGQVDQDQADHEQADHEHADQGRADQRQANQWQADQGQAEHRQAHQGQADQRQANQGQADQGKAEQRQADQRQANQGQAAHGQAEHRQADQGQADQRQANQVQADQGQAEHSQADQGQADQRQANQGQANQGQADQGQAEQRQADQGQADQRQTDQGAFDQGHRFSYDPDPRNPIGMFNWARNFPECGGAHQSPVDIRPEDVRHNPALSCPRLSFGRTFLNGTLKNNGHTIEFEPESHELLRVTGVPYRSGEYILENIHLHWGPVISGDVEYGRRIVLASSEHTLAGRNYDGEVHVALFNRRYGSLEEAKKWRDGVVVLAFFVQRQQPMYRRQILPLLSTFLKKYVPKVIKPQSKIPAVFDLRMLDRKCDFYIYAGSFTTPACEETVKWVVFKEPIPVTDKAWQKLALLQNGRDFHAKDGNSRVTQPLNGRVVESNFPSGKAAGYSMNNHQMVEPNFPLGGGKDLRMLLQQI